QGPAVVGFRREWFLHEHVLPGFDAGEPEREVRLRRRCDCDGVDRRVVEHLLDRRRHRHFAATSEDAMGADRVDIADSYELGFLMAQEVPDEVRAPVPRTDDGDTDGPYTR